ncbi:hypothetical protein [Treponema sp. C6A8]|uniref:hypothetical protein n=1 Tax=Treponema sp. C6A8 TaxID=1410609 RepID=UPI00048827CF|nr:hypothetical protein [Treponema sp. C6A8]
MTKKKTRFKSKLKTLARDFFITFICLGVCAASLLLFWKDLNLSSTRSDKDAIASITFKYKVAQRKFTDRVVWERLQQNSPLYNEDTIRTADMANATITFNGGEILDVHENSMVQIFKSADGSVRLTVGGGGVDVDTSSGSSSGLAIQMQNGSTIQIERGSRLAALNDADGESSFQLRAGSGSLFSGGEGDAGEVSLTAGESVKVENSGEIKKVPLSVTSIPSDLLVLNFEERAPSVHLEWRVSDALAGKSIIVQTSKSKDFTTLENTCSIQNENFLDIKAEAGTLYWRIFEEGNEASDKISGRIRTENIAKTVLTSPLDNSSIKYRTKLPQINFTWEGSDYADYYRLEISSAPDFYQPVLVVDVNSSSYSLNTLKEGTYFWRLTPFYSLQNTGFIESTPVNQFTISKAESLTAPIAVIPGENANLFYMDDSLSTTFRWKSEDGPEGYRVLVSDSELFENIVYQTETKENRIQNVFVPERLPVGQYFWKVGRKASPEEGIEESWSEIKRFNVSYYVPQKNRLIYPPDNFVVEVESVGDTAFSWKLSDEARQKEIKEGRTAVSLIQISKDADFTSLVYESRTDSTEVSNINLDGGNYFWRAGLADEGGGKTEFTQPNRLIVMKDLPAPVITLPLENQTAMISPVRPLKVRWQKVDGADFYSVRIIDKTKNLKIAENPNVKENEVSFQLENIADKFDEFECIVQPAVEATDFTGLKRGSPSAVLFSLRGADPVQLLSPINNIRLDGLKTLKEPVVLNWKEGLDAPEKSQFILQKLQANGSFKTVFVIENPAKAVSMSELAEGTYRWTIIASLADGTIVNAPKYQSFMVGAVPELDKPELLEPSMNFVMNSTFLRKNRVLKFKWNAVEGATDYTFSLYKKTSVPSASGGNSVKLQHIVTEKTGKNTSFRFKDLKLLDVGEFEWQVTAYSINKEGREEQHSKVSVGNFKIDIGLPGKIKVKNPGEIFVE